MAYDVMKVANRLLQRAQKSMTEDGGELLTNLKLQKLLYYEQGFHLACFGTPLFEEEIEAWQYGPVVPCVYRYFKDCEGGFIAPDTTDALVMTSEEEDLFEAVFKTYEEYSAIGLMKLTHEEKPWLSVKPGRGQIITKKELEEFFKTQLE